MKILCVNQTYAPDVAATAQFLSDLCEALAASGHEVTVICAGRDYLDSTVRLQSRESIRGVSVLRVPVLAGQKRSRAHRIVNAMVCNMGMLGKMLMLPRQDRIVALTSPPLVAWFALAVARVKNSALVYWVMDVNPEQAVIAGWLKRTSLISRVLEGALRQVLRRSRRIVVLDRFMSELLASKSAPVEHIAVVPLWAAGRKDTGDKQAAEFRKTHGLTGKFLVMYAGNHSVCHPLDTMLEAARLLKDDSQVSFVFVGGGVRTEDVREWKIRHSLSNVLQLPYLPEEEVEGGLQAADLHVVVMGAAYVGIVHPSKIYRILALGKLFVLIGPEESAIGNLVKERNVGARVDAGNAAGLVSTINETRSLGSEARRSREEEVLRVGQEFTAEKGLDTMIKAVIA